MTGQQRILTSRHLILPLHFFLWSVLPCTRFCICFLEFDYVCMLTKHVGTHHSTQNFVGHVGLVFEAFELQNRFLVVANLPCHRCMLCFIFSLAFAASFCTFNTLSMARKHFLHTSKSHGKYACSSNTCIHV